ncbi:MAG: sodium-translocating pyrophosphatase [Candidatus Nealsonbacteria bacterium CG_4_9_14_0_2_um_filter_37_38]|uniref:K(+)-insensitive pyrophosphate-energized proton pump n=1 Tax=Candidatus Nealsonbacteria bacterium CG_4_10_14_0_8_um_filter_37_14 TaxID=1974684 RepID=A0A2M7R683_9BACT|nr:MAG: sodium-translocating pyrophosphatase [Candidatus Nealsonbacteria bacterium CG11_big_fil_rev_8_21_14_0_20_37_68]PIY88719.1 MAG: sodium-translocating pyrophosphatase [Candidatus Nealsonbacteria bacterium CG_4_10_14_0_8_um_filter_37_14]PJC51549.1 MAG: sodium-translocating pyrophosphatase [Candidatus Nealsonbacteria bacterium CG_4_9_14_0_2_um_filter_37_38]
MLLLSIAISLFSLGFALYLVYWVKKCDEGPEGMVRIFRLIKEGANAFLKRQYKTIGLIAIFLALALFGVYYFTGNFILGIQTSLAFIFGAALSALSGFIGMWIAVRSNVRTANAAQTSLSKALTIALRGGAVSGITIVAMSLLGISSLYLIYIHLGYEPSKIPFLIVGFGFGASLVALFAQLGGGIYTKAADIGADLVGKIEAGIPEDDPRNPAVIADLVGDNVGDCAGRGADLFESTAAENIGAMILGVVLFPYFGISGIIFPLILRAFGLLCSIVGVLVATTRRKIDDPMRALNKGYFVTSFLAAISFYFITMKMLGSIWFFFAALVGLFTSIVFVYITQYYTDAKHRPVQEIVKGSTTGHATNVIAGFSVGLECTAATIITIALALLTSYKFGSLTGLQGGGLYGTAVATMGMLATCAYILAMDTFGPICDNAGGIIEMSGGKEEVRKITDKLDAAGNTTKALTKGYAMGAAALAAFLLFSAYLTEVKIEIVDLAKVEVFVGGLIGAMLIFLFSAFAIKAVGKTASVIINEVRTQFKEDPGIMAGKTLPNYARCVDITTKGALKQMVLPGSLAVVVPIVVGLTLRAEAEAGLIMVGTIVGILLATVLNNSGGAWDNAKKFIEAGNLGGKGSPAHAASVTGDTVGDPFKDTAGPSLHVLVKLLSTLTLALAALFI